METFLHDLRYALRTMLKSPGFTAVAVLALALGIGANTAIFSVVNSVLLRPLPYKDPGRLVHVHRMQAPIERGPISRPDFFEWRDKQEVFSGIGAYQFQVLNLTGSDQAEKVIGARVTGNFFSLFDVPPAAGRFFGPSEDQPGASRVVVISYGLWQRRFGGEADLIGQNITANGDSYTVIGVAPASFQFPRRIDIWKPAILDEQKAQRGSNYLKVIARLKDGVSETQAEAQMNQIAAALARQYPDNDANLTVMIVPLLEEQVRNLRGVLLIMLGAVSFVLLIACSNVANLSLARAATRTREFAIRTALGASRRRIVRQLLTESLLLALAGGALGVLLSMLGVRLLVTLAPAGLPRLNEVAIDLWVLGFTFALSLLAGMVFGLAPALQVSKPDLNEALKEGSRGSSEGQRTLLRRGLVVVEIALSLVLLVGAGLLIGSIKRLTEVSPGFDPTTSLAADISFPYTPAASGADAHPAKQANNFLSEARLKISALPGVQFVGAINDLPVTGRGSVNGGFNVEGKPPFNPGEAPVAEFRQVTPGYFESIGIPVLRGRTLNDADLSKKPENVVVNETFAKLFIGDEDPIGKRVKALDGLPHEIVGVVGDARQWGLDRQASAEIYFSFAQLSLGQEATLVVRTGGDPASLAAAVRNAIGEVTHEAPITRIRPMTEVVEESMASSRFNMILMTIFAGVALMMASIGLYGVISYSVSQRTHEIGIRMALGASRPSVLGLVLRNGMSLALIGVGLGVGAALGLTRLMASLLYGVSPTDPITFIVISLVLTGVALVACFVPANRATRVDPMIALRYE
ncbi:MAG TPA: ABC transporter permease [Blastocatellia bacterium]|nr:ABC transporter permease [Blastocatellia bacterium]